MALNGGACRLAAMVLMLGFVTRPVGAATAEAGRRAYDAGHFTDAMGIWQKLSQQGNAEAEFGLGLLFDLGNGTPEDPRSAFSWYQLAAEGGVVGAEFNIAAMYDSGRGVAQNSGLAAIWYAKAAASGDLRAQFDLGLIYADGDGVPRNMAAAAAWLSEAADGGLPAAGGELNKVRREEARAKPGGKLVGVVLRSPMAGGNVIVAGTQVTLVWTAPAEPEVVHYAVRVRDPKAPSGTLIYDEPVDVTATNVRLPANPGAYEWQVDTIGVSGTTVSSAWQRFSVSHGAGSEVSNAADAKR